MSKGYYHVTNGEWIKVPKRGYKERCRDCGLVHKHNYRITDKGEIEIQSSRDERSTSAVRRAFRFEKD